MTQQIENFAIEFFDTCNKNAPSLIVNEGAIRKVKELGNYRWVM